MTKKSPHSWDASLRNAVQAFAQRTLQKKGYPAALSYAMTAEALRLALQLAPNPGAAFAVVATAMADAAKESFELEASGLPSGARAHQSIH